MLLLTLPVAIAAFVGIGYAWILTYQELREAEVVGSQQITALVGVIAATLQVPLPIVMAIFFVAPRKPGIDWLAGLGILLFLASLLSALRRKGLTRWGLALSSVFFLALTSLVYALSGLQF